MPRFVQPLQWQLTNTDESRLGPVRITMRARITVELEDRSGAWRGLEVIIDTGASFPMMGTLLARNLNLAVPVTTSALPLRTATGLVNEVVRDGEIHLRFTQLRERTFRLKCIFRDAQPSGVPPVLGLHNTIALFNILFDGSRRPDAFMGCMTFVIPDS
jgi:hypothetical protein